MSNSLQLKINKLLLCIFLFCVTSHFSNISFARFNQDKQITTEALRTNLKSIELEISNLAKKVKNVYRIIDNSYGEDVKRYKDSDLDFDIELEQITKNIEQVLDRKSQTSDASSLDYSISDIDELSEQETELVIFVESWKQMRCRLDFYYNGLLQSESYTDKLFRRKIWISYQLGLLRLSYLGLDCLHSIVSEMNKKDFNSHRKMYLLYNVYSVTASNLLHLNCVNKISIEEAEKMQVSDETLLLLNDLENVCFSTTFEFNRLTQFINSEYET